MADEAEVVPSQSQHAASPIESQPVAPTPTQSLPQAEQNPERNSGGTIGPEAGTAAASVASTAERRGSKKNEEKSDEQIKKDPTKDAVAVAAAENLVTQEQAEAPTVLKPLRRPKLIYENTFRLWPYKPFNNENVQKVIEITLEEMLSKLKYKADTTNDLAMKVAERVRTRILSFRFDRCKIIVIVHIGPLYRQGIHVGMKCLWDPLRDSYVSHNYKNTYIYCNCCAYGIYFE